MIWIKCRRRLCAMLGKTTETTNMSVYAWARAELAASLARAAQQGHDPLLSLRALLAEVVELNRQARDVADLAGELEFMADNLDPERDYAFMRP